MLVCIRELTAALVPSSTSMKSFCLTLSSFRCITSDYKHTHKTGYDKHSTTAFTLWGMWSECRCSHDWWRVLKGSSKQRWASETRTESADPPPHHHTPHRPDHAHNPTRTHSGAYCWNSLEPLSATDPTRHWERQTDRQLMWSMKVCNCIAVCKQKHDKSHSLHTCFIILFILKQPFRVFPASLLHGCLRFWMKLHVIPDNIVDLEGDYLHHKGTRLQNTWLHKNKHKETIRQEKTL